MLAERQWFGVKPQASHPATNRDAHSDVASDRLQTNTHWGKQHHGSKPL
jgi:hypothetical protein